MAVSDAPDHVELQNAIVNHLAKDHSRPRTLQIQLDPFKREDWPPESRRFVSELFLSMPALGADRAVLDKAFEQVAAAFANGEILPDRFPSVEAHRGMAFHEDHPELGKVFVLPVTLVVVPEAT